MRVPPGASLLSANRFSCFLDTHDQSAVYVRAEDLPLGFPLFRIDLADASHRPLDHSNWLSPRTGEVRLYFFDSFAASIASERHRSVNALAQYHAAIGVP
jgi:hypothetical protein